MIKINNKAIYTFLLLITFFVFNVSVSAKDVYCTITKNTKTDSVNNTKNTKTGEKLKTFRYQAVNCDDGTKYDVLCLDPGKQSNLVAGARFKKTENTTLAKYAASLDKLYSSNYGCTSGTDSCIIKYQTAMRIAESGKYNIGNVGHSLGKWSDAGPELTTAYNSFENGEADDCSGGVCAHDIAKKAYDEMGSVGTTTRTKGEFVRNGNNIALRITGKNKAPKKIIYTINGRTYTANPDDGNYDSSTHIYTINVPSELLTTLTTCEEVESKVYYDNTSDGEGGTDLSSYPTLVPASSDNRARVQDYVALHELTSSDNGGGNDEVVLPVVGHIGPSTERRTETRTPIICEGEGEYDDDDKPKPCKTKFNLTCAPDDDEDGYEIYSYNEGTANGKGETDWEACIIKNVDIKGNSYDINVDRIGSDAWVYYEDAGWDTINEANFCTISCKEKYEYKMPSDKADVKFGTYFAFDIASPKGSKGTPYHAVAGISNEKQCVTSGAKDPDDGIDIDTYEARILSLRKQLIDYMNVYNYYKAMYDKLSSVKNEFVDYDFSLDLSVGSPISPSTATSRSVDYDSDSIKSDSNWDDDLYNNWLNEKGWDTSIIYDGKQDIYEKALFTYQFSYTQYSLSNSNDVSSSISSVSRTGYTSNAFPTTYTTYLSSKGINFYCSQFGILCNLDTTRGYIDSIDYKNIDEYISYKYHDPDDIAGDIADYYNSNASVHAVMKYQTSDQRSTAFDQMLDDIKDIYEAAYRRMYSIPLQIETQNSGLKKCIETVSGISDYKLEPTITWDYDQTDYMNKMNSKDLVLIDNDSNRLITNESDRKKVNYCSRDNTVSSAGEVFYSCNDSVSDVTFNYLDSNGSTQSMTYKPISRVGVTITNKCNSSDGFCYYGSSTPFATYPLDGKVSKVEENRSNATIIEDDGLVFPVTITTESGKHYYSLKFGNIGENIQTGNISSRLMGTENSVLSGDYKDKAICTYDVRRPTDDDKCDDLVEKYCLRNDGKITKGGYVDDMTDCVDHLINDKKDDNGKPLCCGIAKSISDRVFEYGLWGPDASKIYEDNCDGVKACVGFKLVDGTSGLQAYDQSLISSNGDLQFTVRTVSLNNLFPNGDNKGLNWSTGYLSSTKNGLIGSRGLRIDSIVTLIQNEGESIYGEKPDYKITLTPSCARKIHEENNNGDLDNGFLSYNLGVTDKDNYYGTYLPGTQTNNDEFFDKIRGWGCKVEISDAKKSIGVPNNYDWGE